VQIREITVAVGWQPRRQAELIPGQLDRELEITGQGIGNPQAADSHKSGRRI